MMLESERHFWWQGRYLVTCDNFLSGSWRCWVVPYKMLFLIGKGNLGEQAGCGLTGLGSDDSRIILESRPDRLRTGMDVSCVFFHILSVTFRYRRNVVKLRCYLSLQVQSVVMLQCHLVKVRRASCTAGRTVLDVHGLLQSNMNAVVTPGFASHRLLWHFTGRFVCFAIKLECFLSYRLLRMLSCASLVLPLSDMNAVVTLRFLHPMACSAHCIGRVIFLPQSNINVVITLGFASESHALSLTFHVSWLSNMNVVVTVLGGPSNTL